MSESVTIHLSYRGNTQTIEVPVQSTLDHLREEIARASGVQPVHQKIIATGPLRSIFAKKDQHDGIRTLSELGFPAPSPVKLMLIGPRQEEIEDVQQQDQLAQKRAQPRQYHPSMLRGTKPRSTGTDASSRAQDNPFHSLRVHASTPTSAPEYDLIMSRLRQLSQDEAVIHVCRLHGFQVGELTELLPHEHPNLLGLNENMGQRISLRLRTDRYDGLQSYRQTRIVLLHELAHNKVNDHPPEFKILNSELNAQVEAFERRKKDGTHRLLDMDVYEPTMEEDNGHGGQAVTSHVLGGAGSGAHGQANEDLASRRQRVLQATMQRLEKVEADIERGCGSGG